MPYRIVIVSLLLLLLPAGRVTADPAADAALLQAVSDWQSWNPENVKQKMVPVTAALAAGAGVDARDAQGMGALHYAAAMGNSDLVEIFLIKGADVNLKNSSGATPLIVAAGSTYTWDQPGIIARLLKGGAILAAEDSEGNSALRAAARNPDTGVLSAILANAPGLDPKSNLVSSLLLEAARAKNPAALTTLLAAGATLDAKDDQGRTVVMRALPVFDLPTLQRLLAAEPRTCNLNRRDTKGRTALMYAVRLRDLETVKFLIGLGADFNLENHARQTAFDLALAEGKLEAARFLDSKGAARGMARWFPWLLMLAIILLLISAGMVYAATRKPRRTA